MKRTVDLSLLRAGAWIKYPDAVQVDVPLPQPCDRPSR